MRQYPEWGKLFIIITLLNISLCTQKEEEIPTSIGFTSGNMSGGKKCRNCLFSQLKERHSAASHGKLRTVKCEVGEGFVSIATQQILAKRMIFLNLQLETN